MSSIHSSGKSAVPAHVPAELAFDFDIYNPPGAEEDFHLALKRLHEENYPDIFWSTANGGHWIAIRGEDIYKIFADYPHFSSHNLTVPISSAPPFPLYPIFADPPEHGLYRALLNPSFSPKAVAGLEARARTLAIEEHKMLVKAPNCKRISWWLISRGVAYHIASGTRISGRHLETILKPKEPENARNNQWH